MKSIAIMAVSVLMALPAMAKTAEAKRLNWGACIDAGMTREIRQEIRQERRAFRKATLKPLRRAARAARKAYKQAVITSASTESQISAAADNLGAAMSKIIAARKAFKATLVRKHFSENLEDGFRCLKKRRGHRGGRGHHGGGWR